MSLEFDMKFHIGSNWGVDCTAKDGSGDILDVTGATIRFRLATISGTTVMTRTEADGITITDGSAGQFSINVTQTHQTNASVTAKTYQYEIRVVTAGNLALVQARGTINVLPSLLAS